MQAVTFFQTAAKPTQIAYLKYHRVVAVVRIRQPYMLLHRTFHYDVPFSHVTDNRQNTGEAAYQRRDH